MGVFLVAVSWFLFHALIGQVSNFDMQVCCAFDVSCFAAIPLLACCASFYAPYYCLSTQLCGTILHRLWVALS